MKYEFDPKTGVAKLVIPRNEVGITHRILKMLLEEGRLRDPAHILFTENAISEVIPVWQKVQIEEDSKRFDICVRCLTEIDLKGSNFCLAEDDYPDMLLMKHKVCPILKPMNQRDDFHRKE